MRRLISTLILLAGILTAMAFAPETSLQSPHA